jgi:hypothetical protein
MDASPHAHADYVNTQHDRLSRQVKPIIQLVKGWKYQRDVSLRSFYIELRSTEWATSEKAIIPKYDVRNVLTHLRTKELAAMQDPMGVSGYVYAATDADKSTALSNVETAYRRAVNALEAESNGKLDDAFYYWGQLFNGYFPAR